METTIVKRNLLFSFVNYIVINFLRFLVRIIFIHTLSIEYLGINGLYSNILSVLSLAELGIGPAIVYSLYKPLALKDGEVVRSIMSLYKKVYINIGVLIMALGLCVYPFLDYFIKDKPNIADLNYFYLAFLFNSAISYFWAYKRSLLIADQKQYFVNILQIYAQLGSSLVQIILLVLTHSYWSYIISMIIFTILDNYMVASKADKEYAFLDEPAKPLSQNIKEEIIRNTKAMLGHKIGGIVVFSSSNLIISKFVGLIAVGVYSNYAMVITAMHALANKFFNTIMASIGHMVVTDSKERQVYNFRIIQFFTAFQASVISVGLYVLFNQFIELWVGREYVFEQSIVTAIVVLFYLTYMRKGVLVFHDACGLFWYDRYKPFAEAIINIIACVYLASSYGVGGVIYGTVLSTLLTCFWIEPMVLFAYGIKYELRTYYWEYFEYTIVTIVCAVTAKIMHDKFAFESTLLVFMINMVAVVVFVSLIWSVFFRNREEYIYVSDSIFKILKKTLAPKQIFR